ncbi:MAG TPA: N-acetylneuraminate synthase family protein [Solirubrobacteraceae bacterium]|jgi:sialic acid synthase SpsE|nr:N-acetylneuraminate synthase family protein [Solirubrobacteraceae bacterium]
MTRFIAEIGSNHNGERARCLELVDAAAAAGCSAVKLQVFHVDDLFAAEALARHPHLAARRAWELPLDFLPALRARCDARGIGLGATPFGLWAVEALMDHVGFFKVASYELLWHELIDACAASGKPLILSTGMATLDEVAAAVQAARAGGAEPRLLHCVSGYPTPPAQCNLAAIATLRAHFGVPVGWSDHTGSEQVVRRAVRRWGASDVELHIDLDGAGNEAGEHNWAPARLHALIGSVAAADRGRAAGEEEDGSPGATNAATLDGDGVKRPMPVELADIPWRADPEDGLRPLRALRGELVEA